MCCSLKNYPPIIWRITYKNMCQPSGSPFTPLNIPGHFAPEILWVMQPQTNKLRGVKHSIDYWPSSSQNSRQLEVILTRLRIGHARFTHGHLMETPHAPVPRCSSCNVLISVKHVLIECPAFNQTRYIHFKNNNLSEILAEGPNFSISKIISFLKLTKFYDKI